MRERAYFDLKLGFELSIQVADKDTILVTPSVPVIETIDIIVKSSSATLSTLAIAFT